MIVNSYKKPKRVHFSVYHNKGYFYGKRNNYNSYNKYKNYYNYYKLQNYKKNNNYELHNRGKDIYRKTSLLKGDTKKPKLVVESKNIEIKEKKKEMSKKKCIIKILKRPTEIMKNEETVKKICNKEKEDDKETKEKKKKKNKKTKIEKNGTTKKSKEEGFKFSSTQELFNLLLKDVKENSTEDKKTANQKEYNKKKNENIKIYHSRKTSMNTELEEIKKKENVKDIHEAKRKMEENNIDNKKDNTFIGHMNNSDNNNDEKNTTKSFFISLINNTNKNFEEDSFLLNDKNNVNYCLNNINMENNKNKSIKVIKSSEKNYHSKIYDNALKNVPSKSLYSISYPNILNQTQKAELRKNNSIKNEDTKKTKKEEDANLFVIPLYMRSPKPEQIPIPIYLSEDGDKNISKEEDIYFKEKEKNNKSNNDNINIRENINNACKDKITNAYNIKTKNYTKNLKEFLNINMYKENSLNVPKNNAEKKKKKTYLNKNFVTFNLDKNLKLNYDSMNNNTGNIKKNNKLYNSHSYVKTSNYNNECNQNKNGKNFKVDKFFCNKKYRVKTNFNDNQKNKNFNFLKDVKIAVY